MKKSILVLALMGCAMAAQAWTGSGTQSDPYKIATEADLEQLCNDVNSAAPQDYDGHYFVLSNDITLTKQWTPIGTKTAFKGFFDGQNHCVSNVQVDSQEKYAGFFAQVQGGSISNLRIADGSISGDSIVGGIVGYAKDATIDNCANTATVQGKCQVGGVVGSAFNAKVKRSFNIGAVSSQYEPQGYYFYAVGGVVGYVGDASVINSCYNTGGITSKGDKFYTGGVIGEMSNAEARCCYNIGLVAGKRAGAVLGTQTNCTLDSCYADAQLCPNLQAMANTAVVFANVKTVPTKELTAIGKFGLFVENHNANRYSYYSANIDNDPLVRVSVAALTLADGDAITAVGNDFTVGDASLWRCSNHKVTVGSSNASVDLCQDGTDATTLTATVGNYSRQIALKIANRCATYTKDQTTPDTKTLCASELPYKFSDKNATEITADDFNFASRQYSITRDLTFATVDGCDSVVTYTITCYPLPTATLSDEIDPNQKVLRGGSLKVVYELDGADNNFSFETPGGTSWDYYKKPIFSLTLSDIDRDQDFTLTNLTCTTADGHVCTANAADIDVVHITVVDEVDITINTTGQGTMTDFNPTVKADGKAEKIYTIVPADGWYLSKLENNLDEEEVEKVYVEGGKLRYAFTPTKDTKLTATFARVEAWDGAARKPFMTRNRDSVFIYATQELAWVADQANNQSNDFADMVVILKNDLDMNNQSWTAIESFAGTFNANCKTVSNVQQLFASTAADVLVGFHLEAGEIETADKTVESDYTAITIASKTPLSGGTKSTYSWKRNGEEIFGATEATYTISVGLSAGTYTYTRHATGGCSGDGTQAAGEYKLTVKAPQIIEFSFNSEGGQVEAVEEGGVKSQNLFSIVPNEGFYLDSVLFNGADWRDSVYVKNDTLKLSCIPATGGDIVVKFAKLAPWDGTARKPFMTRNRDSVFIYTTQELAWVAQQFAATSTPNPAPALAPYTRTDVDWTTATVLLADDLDCGGVCDSKYSWSGTTWTPIGTETNPFTATFDGQNREIKNLYINTTAANYQGLFGKISSTAELKNFAVTFGSISGNDYVGCVVGYNDGGKIHHCYNMAEITNANQYVGGIAGYNAGIIEYAYNVGLLLELVQYGGGITGYNAATGTVQNVYSAADAWKGKVNGALVGKNEGTFANAYWDNQMSSKVNGDGSTLGNTVVSKPTSEMSDIFASDATNWVTVAGLYPQLEGLNGTKAAYASVAPVLLNQKADGRWENAHAVQHDFNFDIQNSVTWSTPSNNWLDINGNSAKILYDGCYGPEVFVVANLGSEIKRAKVNIRLDGEFSATYIDTKTDTACSVDDISYISGAKASGGNSDTYVYRWLYTTDDDPTTEIESAVDVTFSREEREYLPPITAPGTYHFYREAKDNACEQNYVRSSGVWTLVLLPPFEAGAIGKLPEMVLCDASAIPTLQDSISASGGDGNISYRWLMDGGEITGATAANYTPIAEQLADNQAHTFVRQAKDGKCNDWKNSENNFVVTLLPEFDAGAIKSVTDELLCLDGDQTTLIVENDKPASGGDGNYAYRWTLSFYDQAKELLGTASVENNAATLNYEFDKAEQLAAASYPIFVTIAREAKDSRCHDSWEKSINTASYIIAQNEASDTTISVCERDFPYTYEYAYNAPSKGVKQITFDNPNDVQTIDDDETAWGCLRTVTITAKATPTPTVAIVDSLLEICEGESGNLFIEIEPLSGNPTKYKLLFDDKAFVSVTEYTDIPADRIIPIKAVGTPQPRIYTASLQFLGGTQSCESEAHRLEISISLDGYLHQKWNDVIVVNNSGTLEGKPLTFVAYQWYRDGQKVENATLQHIYEPDGLSSVYYALLTAADGTRYRTCDFYTVKKEEKQNIGIKVYPVPVRPNEAFVVALDFADELLTGGTLEIRNAQGVKLFETASVANETTVNQTLAQGFYLVRFVDAAGEEHAAKFIVK